MQPTDRSSFGKAGGRKKRFVIPQRGNNRARLGIQRSATDMFVRQAVSTLLVRISYLSQRPTVSVPRLATRSTATPSLVRLLSTDTRSKIEKAVREDPLVVFMKGSPEMPQCGFSRAVLQILQVQGVKPDLVATYNCLEDQELRDGIKEFSDWPTIPQVYINGEFVGGCDIMLNSMWDRRLTEVHQSGELESMLQKAGLLLDPASDQPKSQ